MVRALVSVRVRVRVGCNCFDFSTISMLKLVLKLVA